MDDLKIVKAVLAVFAVLSAAALAAGLIVTGLIPVPGLSSGPEVFTRAAALSETIPAGGTGTVIPYGYVKKEDDSAGEQEEQPEQTQPEQTQTTVERTFCFVGDSRTVGMYEAVAGKESGDQVLAVDDSGYAWAGKVGEGLYWMKSTGVPFVEGAIAPGVAVVILSGVNDIDPEVSMAQEYLDYLNGKAADWTANGAEVYYVSVNPVDGTAGNVTNEAVELWNRTIRDGLSMKITYLDTYHDLGDEFHFQDSLHYQDDTYRAIYQDILDLVQNRRLDENGNLLPAGA